MDESQPPPPSAAPPPPPSGAASTPPPPPPGAPASSGASDNPIAIAGVTVSILGILLAAIVIGFFFGAIGVVLSVVALRRAGRGMGRRGMALSGLILGLLAMVLSVGGFFLILSLANGGEEVTRNGIITTSTNETHPPQEDLDSTVCGQSNSGRIQTASVRITNRSEGASVYRIEVEWETEDGDPVSAIATTEYVAEDDSINVDFVEASGAGLPDTCRVVRIERSSLPLF